MKTIDGETTLRELEEILRGPAGPPRVDLRLGLDPEGWILTYHAAGRRRVSTTAPTLADALNAFVRGAV